MTAGPESSAERTSPFLPTHVKPLGAGLALLLPCQLDAWSCDLESLLSYVTLQWGSWKESIIFLSYIRYIRETLLSLQVTLKNQVLQKLKIYIYISEDMTCCEIVC